MFLFYFLIFAVSALLLYWSASRIIDGLSRVAKFLGWKEFVVAFFAMAFIASLPNLIVGVLSASQGIPELSFGDVAGNNIVALTLAVGLAVFFSKRQEISIESRLTKATSVFTAVAAILPIILLLDGEISRADGIALILFFLVYNVWLFSKKEHFSETYNHSAATGFKSFIIDVGKIIFGILVLAGAAKGVVSSAVFFADFFSVPVIFVGLLITGLGSALPETYFAVVSARKGATEMILGNLMGAVIVPATLVLGVVALIHPIRILDFSPFAVARIFLVASALFFFFFMKTGKTITKKEAMILLALYLIFVAVEFIIL